MINLDADGYPEFLEVAVPLWLTREVGQAVGARWSAEELSVDLVPG
jgi:hypothetical protein